MINIMIDYNVNPCGWFRVMQHTSDLHNHCANQSNEYNLLPLTLAKGEFGDITLLTEFHFNEYILYQEYDYKYTEEGGMRVWVNGMGEHQIMASKCAIGSLLRATSWFFKLTFVPQEDTN